MFNSKLKMFKRIAILIVLVSLPSFLFSQIKVGDNPSVIDSNSILELESNNKVLVITRLSQVEINALTPLSGALVYNTDTKCIDAYDGVQWKNLCDEPNISVSAVAPTINNIGDFWFNSANNIVSVWNGGQWLPININPRRGNGVPGASIVNPLAGDIYVDQITGALYTYNGSIWLALNQNTNVNNGLSMASNTIQLGGVLINPTVLTTSTINTLAIQGLDVTLLDDSKSIVVMDNASGVLQKVSVTNIVKQEQIVIIANDGQTQFNPPGVITDIDKIDVYRNGARIAFSLIDATTIELEPEAICYQGDEIRIVQIN